MSNKLNNLKTTCISLRWYILGKYSDTIITENRNTDCPAEECLVDCLSAVTINEAEVNSNNNMDECRQMYFDEEIATLESNLGSTETFDIPDENINLLHQFESYVNKFN